MNKKLINRALKLASIADAKLFGSCGAIASELQPYFDYDICVFKQESDGFVVSWEDESSEAPHNETVNHVVEMIEKDSDHYRTN